MPRTRHFEKRMSQRGINAELVALALQFGHEYHDGKVILNRKGLENLISECDRIKSRAQDAMNKGGLVVVADNDTLITTYRFYRFRRPSPSNNDEGQSHE